MSQFLKYFFGRNRRPRGVPTHLIGPYDIKQATPEQRLAIMSGRVRSPEAFNIMAEKHEVKTARELIAKLPPPQKKTLGDKLLSLLWRVNGHYRGKPYRTSPRGNLRVHYKVRDRRP